MHLNTSGKQRFDMRLAAGIVALMGGFLLSSSLQAEPTPTWTAGTGLGGSGRDLGRAYKVDREGNRYVTGDFSTTAEFPVRIGPKSESSTHKTLTAAGGTDIFLAKYDPSGKLIWLTQAGGTEDDEGFDIDFDSAGNIYLTGLITDSATFHGTNGKQKAVSGVGQTIFLAKYTPSGTLTWIQTGVTGSDSSNNGYGVAVNPATGSVYVTGVTQGDTAFSSSDGTSHTVSGPFTWHMYLVKYNSAGKFQWGGYNQAEVNTVAHKVAVDSHDNAYATGWMEGQTTFVGANGNNVTVPGFSFPIQSFPDFPCDAYIVKYDEHGNVKWANHIGGYKGIGTEVAVSHDGRISITGIVGNISGGAASQAETIVTSQSGGKNINLGGGHFTNPFNTDVFVATWNSAGVLLDARRFGGTADEGGSGLAYDGSGNLIVAGIFASSIRIAGHTLTGKEPTNLFVAKFADNERQFEWAKEADGPGIDGFENDPRISMGDRGEILVTGSYEPAAQFGQFKLQSAGLGDGFLASLE